MLTKSTNHIPYTKHSISDQDISHVVKVLKSDFLTTGPEVGEFEKNFALKIGTKFAVACSSGTAALHLLAMCVENPKGGNFITCPLTFVADANCAKYVGAEVKFADINNSDWNISINSILEKVDINTRAIVVTHFAGLPADIDKLENFCKKKKIFLIEDACHSPGATINHQNTGTFGDAAIFSLHPAKHIAVGEGGIITTDNEQLYEKLMRLRNHGLESWQKRSGYLYDIKELGFNYRMTDSEAALGNSQLKNLDESVKKRSEIASFYYENINWKYFTHQVISDTKTHAYHLFPILAKDGQSRDNLIKYLRDFNIGATIHYPLINKMTLYKGSIDTTPVADDIGSRIVSIPMYPSLKRSEIEYVVKVLNSFDDISN